MLKKLFSHLIPINIFKQKSGLSKSLEITWVNGELVLDSENTNYSYGSLQRILRKGLKNIGYKKIVSMRNILVLGVAGGSVIKTLVDEIQFKGKITGVEIDPEIIRIANQFFELDKVQNLEIVIEDAFEYVLRTNKMYDLIVIDVFQDKNIPNFLFESFFTDRLKKMLNVNGFLLFNTMILNELHEKRNLQYLDSFADNAFLIKTLPRIEQHNELIIAEKLINNYPI